MKALLVVPRPTHFGALGVVKTYRLFFCVRNGAEFELTQKLFFVKRRKSEKFTLDEESKKRQK